MGVYKKGTNWYIDFYVKGRRKRKKIGPSKKLAEQTLRDVQVKLAKAEYLGIYDEKKLLFKDYTEEYADYSKANKAASTYERRDKVSLKHLKSAFGDCYLYELTSRTVEDYKAERLKHVSPSSVNRELACLKHMYNKAIEWKYVQSNPVKTVKFLKEPPGRIRYLREEEVNRLIKACTEHLKPIVITALNTGMRRTEILSLKWSDIDLDQRKIVLRKTKNNEVRVIPTNKTLFRELTQLYSSRKGDYVFTSSKGKPFIEIKNGFIAAIKKANISDFRFHDLRHTFGSHLVMQGVNIRTVQQLLGHKDIKMTMRYSHLSPEYVHEAIERLDNSWTPYGHQKNNAKTGIPVSV